MNLPDKFKFEVVGGKFPVYYANKLNSTVYEISWKDNNKVKSCKYSVPSVESVIKTEGIWKIIKEEENMTTKLKPFNLEKALAGEKVVTRGGQEVVKIVHFKDATPEECVVFQVEDVVYLCNEDGKYYKTGVCSQLDLFMAPIKKQGWVNIYGNDPTETGMFGTSLYHLGIIFKTKEEAMDIAGRRLIDTVMIKWEE